MTAIRLGTRRVEKVWGRRRLGLGFGDVPEGEEPVGEIWFEAPPGAPDELLVKYLFTSEKLSVQVHPDDAQARERGHRRGKEECWLVLDADPDATIGIGLVEPLSRDTLRAAATDGSIEALLDWRRVAAGDVFYLSAGTVHAIGAGVTLVEIQQNVDLTYRLYDYGRPRELHLDDAVAVARPEPWRSPSPPRAAGPGRTVVAEGRRFVIERREGRIDGRLVPAGRPCWLVPLSGEGALGGETLSAGTVWLVDEEAPLAFDGDLLIAYPGSEAADPVVL